jgi:hypothetical protein
MIERIEIDRLLENEKKASKHLKIPMLLRIIGSFILIIVWTIILLDIFL